ncbi:MAG TPA: DUF389 domain-containing protein, partial [Polyangiaceae bacterium]|nr:DUF389 domain-containing protein [Polyangiaceae bacterium]
MLHLRVVAPADLVAPVLEHLGALESVINVVHLPGAARKPEGDLITCDVAREDGSIVLAALRQLGCEARGTVTVEALEASLSRAADDAEEHAVGSAADAVVWEAVSAQTSESAELSFSYLLFMTLAALIAAVGVLTDSVVLIIGAMVVGPEFGPLAGLCVALVQRRYVLAGRSALALLIGFAVGVVAAAAFTALLVAAGLAPTVPAASHPQTLFISRPDAY